jgi:hypothetical protein
MWFLASVPATARTVTVTITAGQYPQTFDLNTMTRQAPTPVALYRTVGSWETTETLDVTDQIPTPDLDTDFGDQLADATLPVHLHTVTLSWFAPDTPTDIPTNPDQAWLQVDLSSQPGDIIYSPNAYLGYQTPITSSQLTLTIPGEPPIPATVYPGGGPDNAGVGIFTGRYAFEVPANLTTATLTVTPGTLQADSNVFLGTQTITAQGDATFPITLPPITTTTGPAPGTTSRQHPGALVPTPATTHPSTTKTKSAPANKTTGGTTGTTNNSGDRSTTIIVIITVIVLAAATAGLTYTRRHRRHQKPATAGPTTNGHRSPASHEPPHPQPAPPTYRTAPTDTARWAGSNTRTTATTTTTAPSPRTPPRTAGTSVATHPQSTVNASNRSADRTEPPATPTEPEAPSAAVPPRTPPAPGSHRNHHPSPTEPSKSPSSDRSPPPAGQATPHPAP